MKTKLFATVFNSLTLYIILTLSVIMAYPVTYKTSAENIEITITEKERITTGNGKNISSKFIVYTENEVFENTDSWLYLKFNSADYQNNLKIGETYTVKVAGWRIPFLSIYRNIVYKY